MRHPDVNAGGFPMSTDAPEWLSVPMPTGSARQSSAEGPATAEGFSEDAQWIGRPAPAEPAVFGAHAPAPWLRREFDVAAPVASATLTVVGFGYYEIEINGFRVGDAVLDPPMSQFDRTSYSRRYDVTELLRSGPNAIGATLGRGFISGITGPGAPWTSEPRLLAQLDLVLADGREHRVVSDADWRMSDSPTRDWLYYGETYDARLEQPGWSEPHFDDSRWAAVEPQPWPTHKTVPAQAPPVKVMETWAPVNERRIDGVAVFDAGKVTAGWARVTVRGQAGTRLRISYGQQVDDRGRALLFAPTMHVDEYVLRGGEAERWEPRFTRHSFQFVEIEVIEGAPLLELDVEVRENYTAVEASGTFTTSNTLLQKIHDNHQRSLLLNHWGFPTDTAGRDRQGWTADTALYLDSAMHNFAGLADLYRDWLGALRDTQQIDGSVSIFAPDSFQYPMFNDPSWSGMLILIPWRLYQHTGDLDFLEDNHEAMLAWMDLMETTIAATGDLYEGFSFGDHSPPGAEDGGTISLSPPEGSDITRNAHLYLEARTLAKISRTLGTSDAPRWDLLAERILTAFNVRYLHELEGEYQNPSQVGYRQTSNLVPLAFDMVPADHHERVLAGLVADLEGRGARLNTGAIGTKQLLPTLTRLGHADLAYRIATQTAYPSWGYWVTQGASSSWETWSNQGPEQTLDHPFLGTIDDWFFQDLAGIRPGEPGYAAVDIAPIFPQDLDEVAGSVTSARGAVSSAWKRDDTGITVTVHAPEAVPATLKLPASTRATLQTGSATRDDERNQWTGLGTFIVHITQEES
jgi:alpha-L-rhamnosidase